MALTIQERLKDLRVERGLTLEQLAEQTHLSKSALGSYEGDKFKDISHYALIELAKFYEVTVDYLLGRSQTKNHPNADLADLRLSDDMIELLKSRRVDNSLLCELATHPDFPRLMADLEIYVNGMAVKQVQSANAIVDAVSATIMKQHNPGLTDPQLKQLIAAHIDDDSFCRYVIQQDINKIALDLREAHKDDFFSVPEDNPLEDFLQTAEEAAKEDSDPEQAALAFICKRLKLNYKKLSEEEKKWLKKIAQKSDLLKIQSRSEEKSNKMPIRELQQHKGKNIVNTPTLETKRLILRKFTENDMEALFLILKDKDVNKFLPWYPMKSLEETKKFYEERYATKYAKPQAYTYAICLKEDNYPIGYIKVDMEEHHDFGYALRKEFWHKGIASEAAKAVVEQVKKDGLPYITATHDRNNPRSGHVMKAVGMKYCYTYEEQWQPKDIPVFFRMYQLNFDGNNDRVYRKYWNMYENHFVEELSAE